MKSKKLPNFQTKAAAILTLMLLVAGLIVSNELSKRSTENRSDAAPSTTISQILSTTHPKNSTTFTDTININTGLTNSVIITEVYLKFDASKLEVASVSPGNFFSTDNKPEITFNNGTGDLSIFGKIPPNSQGLNEGIKGQGSLAVITFRTKAEGTSTISFDNSKTIVGAYEENTNALASIAQPVTVTVLNPTPTPLPAQTVLKFTPLNGSFNLNAPQIANVVLNTGSNLISAADIGIAMVGTIPSNASLSLTPPAEFNNVLSPVVKSSNQFTFSLGTQLSNTFGYTTNGSDVVIGKLSYTPTQTGTLSLSYLPRTKAVDSNNANMIKSLGSGSYNFVSLVTPTPSPVITPTPTPIVTPSPTPSPSPTLKPTPTPTICPSIPGDANKDCLVNGQDYVLLFQYFGQPVNSTNKIVDFNNDSKINSLDYVILYRNYRTE